ncbi:unnamed protein product [Gordionus sp. m RMFG-2023]
MNYTFHIYTDRNSSTNFSESIPYPKILSIRLIFSSIVCVLTTLGVLGNGLIIYGLLLGTKNAYGKTLKLFYHTNSRYYLIWISLIGIGVCILAAFRACYILKYPINCFTKEMSVLEAIFVTKFRQVFICNVLFLSHWFMAVMSARSFIAIKYPIFYRIKFLDKELNLDIFIMVILLVVSFVTSFPFLYDKRIYPVKSGGGHILKDKYFFTENEKFKSLFDVYYRIEMAISITIPCTLIMVFNLITWYLMYKKGRYNIANGILLGSRNSSVKAPKFKVTSNDNSGGMLIDKNSSIKTSRKFRMRSENFEIVNLNCKSSSSNHVQSEENKATRLQSFAVMASLLTTITFLFSLPITVMTSQKSEHKLFDINCYSLSYMLAYIFLILKHFIYPYLIVFGNPALRSLIFKKITYLKAPKQYPKISKSKKASISRSLPNLIIIIE